MAISYFTSKKNELFERIFRKILDAFWQECYNGFIVEAITFGGEVRNYITCAICTCYIVPKNIMLKILDEKVLKTDEEIRRLYKNCKYVYIIDSYDKVGDDEGYLYCVSMSDDSYDELINERDRLEDNGKICVLGGNYNNGGAVGVQYEIKG